MHVMLQLPLGDHLVWHESTTVTSRKPVPPNLKDSLIDFDEVTAGAWLLTVSGAFSFSVNTWPLLIQIEGTAEI